MRTGQNELHPSDSTEQRQAEAEILAALKAKEGLRLDGVPSIGQPVRLDGFEDGEKPVCVEVFAHQGPSKDGQRKKLMRDMCKLLLVEKLLAKPCRKIVAGCDDSALSFLKNSWQGRFADEFGIELIVVDVDESTREKVRKAQRRQRR
jgi:hypothetical protein